jgi:hypothetical protein
MNKNVYSNKSSMAYKYRNKRHFLFKKFLEKIVLIENKSSLNILDVGGTVEYWKVFNYQELPYKITLLNLDIEEDNVSNITMVKGNATDMKFNDKQFDVVFSNSVIEHLGDIKAQKMMALESLRVGKYFFIQTPNFLFPIEPHYRMIGFQFLPVFLKALLIQYFRLRQKKIRKSRLAWEKAMVLANSINLLTKRKLKSLFTSGTIKHEKVFLFTKSFIIHSDI